MQSSRRALLLGLSGAAGGFAGLKLLLGSPASAQTMVDGYGPLIPDPGRLLDLPKDFSYRIVSREGETVYAEGCLSLPGEVEDVERAAVVPVRYQDEQGDPQPLRCEGLLAIAVQHELDHLDGIVFVDHVSVLKRELIRRRMKRLQAGREPRPVG